MGHGRPVGTRAEESLGRPGHNYQLGTTKGCGPYSGKAKEVITTETKLKALGGNCDRLVSIAQSVKEEAEERNEEELLDMLKNVKCNKGCMQKMAKNADDFARSRPG